MIRITTYNVGLLDAWVFGKKIFEFAPHTRARAKRLPVGLASFESDLLFLQELYHPADVERVSSKLSSSHPYSFHAAPAGSKFTLGHGLSVFSRFPLRNMENNRFERQLIDEGIIGPKGFISGTVVTQDFGEISFANAHTTAGGFFEHPESARTDSVRFSQLQQIANKLSIRSNPCIVAGDLNCGPNVSSSVFSRFLQLGLARPEQFCVDHSDEPTWDPLNPLNAESPHKTSPPQRIDHLLLSQPLLDNVSVEGVKRVFTESLIFEHGTHTLSDHYGLQLLILHRGLTPRST
jgi:endonuclease/exonuclease/phosphatase family metal-dependent hydrolase